MYELIEQPDGKIIKRNNENGTITWIPMDEANSDYQAYLKSLEEGTAQQLGGNPIGLD